MGSISAKKLAEVVTNVRNCLAIELMVAAAGVDARAPLEPSRAVGAALGCIRRSVAKMDGDRVLYTDIEALSTLIEDGTLLAEVRRTTPFG